MLFRKKFIVSGDSMIPTVSPGERVIVNQLSYILRHPRVGDIVLARHPLYQDKKIIKRISRIQITPSGEIKYHLEGDNTVTSEDSRAFGPLRKKDILGKVLYAVAD